MTQRGRRRDEIIVSSLFRDVRFLQRLLRAAGCYSGNLSGVRCAATRRAERLFLRRGDELASRHGAFDVQSERNIRTLLPEAQVFARQFLARVRAAGLDVRIKCGTRSYAEQNALYRIGRCGDRRKVVTNARGGFSNHNFGIAWDVALFENGEYQRPSPLYERTALAGLVDDLEWGGYFDTFRDYPHYQLATGLCVPEIRACFESGKAFLSD